MLKDKLSSFLFGLMVLALFVAVLAVDILRQHRLIRLQLQEIEAPGLCNRMLRLVFDVKLKLRMSYFFTLAKR